MDWIKYFELLGLWVLVIGACGVWIAMKIPLEK